MTPRRRRPASPRPWCRSARRSTSRSSRRASSSPSSGRRCATSAATRVRASSSRARWTPTRCSTSCAARRPPCPAPPTLRPSRRGPMHHSYEGLDRPGGFSRVRMLTPLRHRDFRLLWSGMCVSLMGDGIFLVAMAWQVYALSNAPTALALVGIAMTVPTIAFLLLGGVVSDRADRRRVMLAADITRGIAVALMAVLSLTGVLALWHVVALVALYGAGAAFFGPAFDAIVPDVLPASELPQANSLDQFVRPIALRLAGPALGGLLIDAVGVGSAFAFDAASFGISVLALVSMSTRVPRGAASAHASVGSEIRTGLGYVRRHVWLWATFATAAIAYLLFMGPAEVLLPY